MTSTSFNSSTASAVATLSTTTTTTTMTTTTETPTSSGAAFTTWPLTTYTLPTLTSWGTTPNGFGDFNVGDRILQLVTSGSNGEKVVRGFLMGVAIGIILGGALCCWVPCFGRGRQERRRRRRQQREQAEQQARHHQTQQVQQNPGGQTDGQTAAGTQQPPLHSRSNPDVPDAERSYVRLHWDRLAQRRRQRALV